MYLAKERKEEIFEKHGKSKTDTGSAEGQIALFTEEELEENEKLIKKYYSKTKKES